ncbi:hypothetical protein DFH29DRAFT_581017 [Suillus ampliporus]|nr:hypothetical protein DFH29DRAFT_581017 [Suillus ampliporus]
MFAQPPSSLVQVLLVLSFVHCLPSPPPPLPALDWQTQRKWKSEYSRSSRSSVSSELRPCLHHPHLSQLCHQLHISKSELKAQEQSFIPVYTHAHRELCFHVHFYS